MLYMNYSMWMCKFTSLIMPDTYRATSIEDFVKNAETIPKPSHWKKLFIGPYIGFGDNVIVSFHDVGLGFCDDGLYSLSDSTGEIYVQPPEDRFHFMGIDISARRKNLREREYMLVSVLYHPIKKRTELFYAL